MYGVEKLHKPFTNKILHPSQCLLATTVLKDASQINRCNSPCVFKAFKKRGLQAIQKYPAACGVSIQAHVIRQQTRHTCTNEHTYCYHSLALKIK